MFAAASGLIATLVIYRGGGLTAETREPVAA
jgi:hypothetical protein